DRLPVERLAGGSLTDWAPQAAALRPEQVGLVELAGDLHYRYLVVAAEQHAAEQAVVDAYNARNGGTARALYDLRDVAYLRPPVEQYLTWTGRTYYKGMAFSDLRRLQFDLETTGLNKYRDRIFMIAVRDSSGFEEVLDGTDEAELLRRFVALVLARDPDV